MSGVIGTSGDLLGVAAVRRDRQILAFAFAPFTASQAGASGGDSLDVSLLGLSSLGQLYAAVDEPTRIANALSTAHDAVDVIGGLLTNIRGVLDAPHDGSDPLALDRVAEQSRIDSAVSTVDEIAGRAQFGGSRLLDGSYVVTTRDGRLAIPSFLSQSLGATSENGVAESSSPALNSLVTGGANSLATGRITEARAVVDAAQGQVSSTLDAVAARRQSLLGPELSPAQLALAALRTSSRADAVLLGADMAQNPALTVAATAHAHPQRVFYLVRPDGAV